MFIFKKNIPLVIIVKIGKKLVWIRTEKANQAHEKNISARSDQSLSIIYNYYYNLIFLVNLIIKCFISI